MKYLFIFSIVFNLISCHHQTSIRSGNSSIQINNTYKNYYQVDSLLQPYKSALDKEMNEVLVISAEEFPKEKGKAETKLGNLVADLSLTVANKMYLPKDGHTIDFCLLNNGGLRTSLPKGEITRGKIFELMPFENELVVVTIDKSKMASIRNYLKEVGGQPIAGGYRLLFKSPIKKDNVIIHNDSTTLEQFSFGKNVDHTEVKILTTDYLANGGDQMNFFLDPINRESIGIKLRDAIITYCQDQHNKDKKLVGKLDGRIKFE